jgi:hypothetical protein
MKSILHFHFLGCLTEREREREREKGGREMYIEKYELTK